MLADEVRKIVNSAIELDATSATPIIGGAVDV